MDTSSTENQDTTPSAEPAADATGVLTLRTIEAVAREIEAMRRVQQARFREAAIAAALVTWGASVVPTDQEPTQALGHVIAAVVCITVGVCGALLLRKYRDRIHYLRSRRNELAEQLPLRKGYTEPLFPKPNIRFTTSMIYLRALLAMTLALAVFNLVLSYL